jgi:hypothetical protein
MLALSTISFKLLAAHSQQQQAGAPMVKKRTLQVLAQSGAILSAAIAIVAYLINTGGGSGGDHTSTWCWFVYFVLMFFAFQYWFYCVTRCPGGEPDGSPECFVTCTIQLIFILLVLLVGLLLCLIASHPHW